MEEEIIEIPVLELFRRLDEAIASAWNPGCGIPDEIIEAFEE